eukprot:gene5841-9664_t
MSRKIIEGDTVVLRVDDGEDYFVVIKKNSTIKMRKKYYQLGNLIGKDFFSWFQIDHEKKILKLAEKAPEEDDLNEHISTDGIDNRNIVDDGNSQSISVEDINEMRIKNMDKQEIITKLIEGSKSFSEKTNFSQEKYIKRKKKKYYQFILVCEPTIFLLADLYFKKNPSKISHLRIDSLSRLMTLGNIQPKNRILLFETCAGLVSGCILDRLGSTGQLIHLYVRGGRNTHFHLARQMNFETEILKNNVKHLSFDDANDENIPKCDSLIISTATFDHKEILLKLFPFLKSNGYFAIYSNSPEALTSCYEELEKDCVMLRISETLMRDYQVLPMRTHPEMKTSATGGYILSGIKVSK